MESNRPQIVPDIEADSKIESLVDQKVSGRKFEVVLGGGGIKGFGHIGLLKAIEEKEIGVESFTGISIGSLIATMYVNGYQPDEINEILCAELNVVISTVGLEDLNWNVRKWVTVSSALFSPYLTLWNFEKILRSLTLKYHLRPQTNLRIVASNLFSGHPVIFEGEDYDLPAALAASCAFPFVVKPVILDKAKELTNRSANVLELPGDFRQKFGRILEKPSELSDKVTKILLGRSILIDGGIHHPHPGHFCKGPAIISKLGFARQLPNESLSPAEYMCHVLELIGSSVLDNIYRDPSEHIVVPVGMPDVGILSFALPMAKCQDMVAYGYDQAEKYLAGTHQDKSVA
jgi:predicted acylesterase/phospholipase RssA